ncbi:MAG TPA: hypothetical protein VEC16_01205 [Alphaproteobacteria bacterium]|nr:hypothetical protein [Alphaproteobacteria bacterium]
MSDYKSGSYYSVALAAAAVVYYINTNKVEIDSQVFKNNLEAILVKEEKKKFVNKVIRLKDDDIYRTREVEKYLDNTTNQRFSNKKYNRQMGGQPLRKNQVASNHTSSKILYRSDRRNIRR